MPSSYMSFLIWGTKKLVLLAPSYRLHKQAHKYSNLLRFTHLFYYSKWQSWGLCSALAVMLPLQYSNAPRNCQDE